MPTRSAPATPLFCLGACMLVASAAHALTRSGPAPGARAGLTAHAEAQASDWRDGAGGGPAAAPRSLREALFGSAPADRHFGATPTVARFEAGASGVFVLDRQPGGPLLKFENSPEVWALTAVAGPRGDVIYKNDVGEPVLRTTRLGGLTVFTDTRPTGAAASLVGQGTTLRPPGAIGPEALLRALGVASARASRAAQHLVVFDAPDVTPARDWVFADAATLAGEAFARLALHGAATRPLLARFAQVTLISGSAAGVQAVGALVQIVVAPEQGVAGRPSSERIYAVIAQR